MQVLFIITAAISAITVFFLIFIISRIWPGVRSMVAHKRYLDCNAAHYDVDKFKSHLTTFFKDAVMYDVDSLRILLYQYIDRAVYMTNMGLYASYRELKGKSFMLQEVLDASVFEPLVIVGKDKRRDRKQIIFNQWQDGFLRRFEKHIVPSLKQDFELMEDCTTRPYFNIESKQNELSAMANIVKLMPESSLKKSFSSLSTAIYTYLVEKKNEQNNHGVCFAASALSDEIALYKTVFKGFYEEYKIAELQEVTAT